MSGSDRARGIFRDLMTGNAKYVAGLSSPQSTLSPPSLREDLAANGQAPGAAIVACADSRVAPEIVFNAGLGQVFVIRNAGNATFDDSVIGSLEYAVAHLNVPLVIVLGHSNCGAIGAAVGCAKKGATGAESSLGRHVEKLAAIVKSEVDKEEPVKESVDKNVRENVRSLLEGTSGVAELARKGDVSVMGAVYDLHSGEVQEVV